MLHLILGAAGTGKTALLHEKIAECVCGGGKAVLLVPEQYSFESEKALYRRLGAKDALSVEVLSFTRLCDRIFREYGGLAGVHLDETAKVLLMSVALGEIGGELRAYRKNVSGAAFAATMCEAVGELKTAGADPETLRAAAADASEDLRDKLSDVALIFDAYQALIERGYCDPDDSLRRACRKLEGRGFFAEYSVFIDGFMAFMGAEWKLLGRILEGSPAVWAALPCDGLSCADETGAFAAAAQTANRLVRDAKAAGVPVAAPVVLREPRRFARPALAHIAVAFSDAAPEGCETHEGVKLAACEDLYDELEFVASRICALVREEGCRYRDIAVIGRDLDRYLVPLETVFTRYEIPFFADLRADIQVHPFAAGLLAALDAARSGFDSEHLLALAKNCVTGIGPAEAGELENYCFVWGASGAAWRADFTNNPDGMSEGFTEEQAERLGRINETRRKLAGPLVTLRRELADCDGRGFAAAAFGWLERVKAAEHLQEAATGMEEGERKRFLEMSAQVWEALLGLLDVFGGALADVRLPLGRLIDLLRMGISAADIGLIPQTIDQVIVGAADRIRPDSPRAVFVIGFNEGVFPRWETSAGIFSAAERDLLKARGVDLLRTPGQTALFERYYVYFALTQASERLCVSWPLRDTAGAALAPSSALDRVRALTGCPVESSLEGPLGRVANERTAFDELARGWRERTPAEASLRAWFSAREPARMEALARCAGTRGFSLNDRAAARALFGAQVRISPSRAEQYYQCPFSYFCKAGLRISPRRRVEFNPIESGSLIHLVLEKMVKKYGGRGLSALDDARLEREVTEIIETDLSAKIANLDEMPARFRYLFRRLVGTLVRLLRRLAMEFAQSEFEPAAFELPINLEAEMKPLDLRAPDGTRVIVEGIVDRMDVLEREGVRYVRVVDYKSGHKSFNLSDVCYGLNMQMLIYLFSICENAPGGGAVPAGVLYMPARDSVVSAERGATEGEVRAEQQKRLRMNGILLEDREVLSAMEPGLAGLYIPVRTKKDGSFDAHSQLATLEQMGTIRRQVERLLIELADSLAGGKIDAAPVDGLSDYRPCDWCDYHAVCGHEDSDAVRKLAELDRAAALKAMEGDEADG